MYILSFIYHIIDIILEVERGSLFVLQRSGRSITGGGGSQKRRRVPLCSVLSDYWSRLSEHRGDKTLPAPDCFSAQGQALKHRYTAVLPLNHSWFLLLGHQWVFESSVIVVYESLSCPRCEKMGLKIIQSLLERVQIHKHAGKLKN